MERIRIQKQIPDDIEKHDISTAQYIELIKREASAEMAASIINSDLIHFSSDECKNNVLTLSAEAFILSRAEFDEYMMLKKHHY